MEGDCPKCSGWLRVAGTVRVDGVVVARLKVRERKSAGRMVVLGRLRVMSSDAESGPRKMEHH